ncbi:MAG: DEAD/DEAH box helicase, partial [Opitutales bacterium]|nr:DEAD/DEAH box helicase [Opitutales bacterium]
MSFADLGLSENILSTVEKIGFKTPTPIQEKAIPVALQGRDIIGAAQTGTGKTAAYALPTLARLGAPQGKPRCLVLVPTRELAMQVDEAFRLFGETTKIALLYGGVRYDQQLKALRDGAEVVVATPGRLIDLWRQRFVDLSG